MINIEKHIKETASKYGEKIKQRESPDQFINCPVCSSEFTLAEVSTGDHDPDFADRFVASITKQMKRTVDMAEKGVNSLHEIISEQKELIDELEISRTEAEQQRDAMGDQYVSLTPRLTCIKDIFAIVKQTKVNIAALAKNEPDNVNKMLTAMSDSIDNIELAIEQTFFDEKVDENKNNS